MHDKLMRTKSALDAKVEKIVTFVLVRPGGHRGRPNLLKLLSLTEFVPKLIVVNASLVSAT
jgi:hypothetical protein